MFMRETVREKRVNSTYMPAMSKVHLRNRIKELLDLHEKTGVYNYLIMAAILKAYYITLGGQKGIAINNIDKDFLSCCKRAFIALENTSRSAQERVHSGKISPSDLAQLVEFVNISSFNTLGKQETLFMNRTAVVDSAKALLYRR